MQIRIGGVAEVAHPSGCREVRNGFQVPRDDLLLRHTFKLAYSIGLRLWVNPAFKGTQKL